MAAEARDAIEPKSSFEAESVELPRKLSSLAIAACAVFALISGIPPLLVVVVWATVELALWLDRLAARSGPLLVSVEGTAIIVARRRRRMNFAVRVPPDAWQLPDANGVLVSIVVRGGTVSIRLRDANEAARFLRELRVDADQQLVGTTLSSLPVLPNARVRTWIVQALSGTAVLATWVALLVAGIGRFSALVVWAALALVVLSQGYAWVTRAIPYRVLVGRDGLQLRGFDLRRFIGYERIAHARATPFGVGITLVDDEILILPLSPPRAAWRVLWFGANDTRLPEVKRVRARRDALVSQIAAALERWRSTAHLLAAGVLERRGRSIGEWSGAVSTLMEESYRNPAIGLDAIVDVLENPRSSAEQRVGAALALRGETSGEIADRVRAAIESCASPELRRALERARAGSLDETSFERATSARPR